jgi:hypothetical protein
MGELLEQLTAIGVWATRPHLSYVAAKVGDSPTVILCGYNGGRVALPPFPLIDDELKFLLRYAATPQIQSHFGISIRMR